MKPKTIRPAFLSLGLTLLWTVGAAPLGLAAPPAPKPYNPEYPDFYTGEDGTSSKGIDWVQAVFVDSPAYGANIKGDVTVKFHAAGMTQAKVLCWQQPTKDQPNPWGHDAEVVRDLPLPGSGEGSFVFHAEQFPNGPLTVRILAKDNGKKQDVCELQLYNQGGAVWNQGLPKIDPPAAKDMKLVFSDDFASPLSISKTGAGAKYESHKTGGGDFSGWPFSDSDGPNNPFSQVGTFLRIHASKDPDDHSGAKPKSRSGILSSAHEDGSGFYVSAPCYLECRLMAQSAPGTWPAFWTLTKKGETKATDELDVLEAYGGWGPHNPNSNVIHFTSHFWNQGKLDWQLQMGSDGKRLHPNSISTDPVALGGKSSWSTTFHTYGVSVTATETVYYFDGIETLRHPTGPLSRNTPFFFMINYAIGGISHWPIDLARYGNGTDMWVDYVRVYQGRKD